MTSTATEAKLEELRRRLSSRGIDPVEHDDMLRIYADAYVTWVTAATRIDGSVHLVKTPKGDIVPSPWVEIKAGAAETMDRVGRQLGFSPDHNVTPTLPRWADFAAAVRE